MEKVILSAISAFIGFMLSQSVNVLGYIRRPKFRVKNHDFGVISSYSGDPPETPWEIELGFFLENYGYNIAHNTRIFVSDIACSERTEILPELTSSEMIELKRPINFIPSGECVSVKFGTIISDKADLKLNSEIELNEHEIDLLNADTRGSVRFSARFYVTCDDKNSFTSFLLDFRPDIYDFSSALLEDFTEEHLKSITRPKII